MLDYIALENSTEFPAFYTIFYTVLLAFLLSSLIAFTYAKTTRYVITPIEYLQSLILVSIVSATIMQAIGDSLARGLGMLGALAIIRYRVTLKTPRNMVFTFSALAAGIACGVYAFIIALTGTIGFCLIAFAMRFSPLGAQPKLLGTLKFDLENDINVSFIEQLISQHSKSSRNTRFQLGKQQKTNPTEEDDTAIFKEVSVYEYEIDFKNLEDSKILFQKLSSNPSIGVVKLNYEMVNENV